MNNKTNADILLEIKQMQADHEAIKSRMLRDFNTLEEIEKCFDEANMILSKRLKGDN